MTTEPSDPKPCPRCGGERQWGSIKEIKAWGGKVVRRVGTDPYCPANGCTPTW